MNNKKLIMGVSWGLGADGAMPFLESIRVSDYDGRVILFVADTPEADVERLCTRAEVIVVDRDYPPVAPTWAVEILRFVKTTRGLRKHYVRSFRALTRILRIEPGSSKGRDLEFRLQGLQAHRYRHYLNALESTADEAEQIMISDVRDVVVQRDPFVDLNDLEFYLEEEASAFGQEGFNSRWLASLYGEQTLEHLNGRLASCSGVTIGPRSHMLQYLRAMSIEIDRHRHPLGPHDQAIHNYLINVGAFPQAKLVVNGEGRVRTLSFERDINRSAEGDVLNKDSLPVPVVHQFDRFSDLREAIYSRYAVNE